MVEVTSKEFQNAVGRYQDKAARAPVIITRYGRPHSVLLSAKEYARLKTNERRALPVEDLSDEQLAEILNAKAPAQASDFDHELSDQE